MTEGRTGSEAVKRSGTEDPGFGGQGRAVGRSEAARRRKQEWSRRERMVV